MENDIKFVLQFLIDQGKTEQQAQASYDAMKEFFSAPIPLNITPEVDTSKLKTETAGMVRELDKVVDEVKEAEAEFEKLQQQVTETAKAVEQKMPQAVERMRAAIRAGTEEGQKELRRMIEEIRTSGGGAHAEFQAAIGNRDVDAVRKGIERVSGRLKKAQEVREAIADPKTSTDAREALQRELFKREEAAKEAHAELKEMFAGDAKALGNAVEAYKRLRTALKNDAAEIQQVEQTLTTLYTQLQAAEGAGANLSGLRGRAQALGSSLAGRTAQINATPRTGAAVAGGAGLALGVDLDKLREGLQGLKIGIDAAHLVAEVQKAFDAHPMRINIDEAHLRNQIVKVFDNLPMIRVGINPTDEGLADKIKYYTTKAAESARAAMDAVRAAGLAEGKDATVATTPRKRRTEADRLADRALVRGYREEGLRDPNAVIAAISNDVLSRLHAEITKASGSGDKEALRKAIGLRGDVLTELNAAQGKSLPRDLQHKLDAVAQGYNSAFIRPLIQQLDGLERAEREAADERARSAKASEEAANRVARDAQREREANERRVRDGEALQQREDARRSKERAAETRAAIEASRLDAFRTAKEGVQGTDPLAYLRSVAPQVSGFVADMARAFEKIPTGTKAEDVKDIFDRAQGARRQFTEAIERLIAEAANDVQRAQLKGIQQAVGARFGTPLGQIEQSAALTGARANLDPIAREAQRQQWDEAVKRIRAGANEFAQFRFDFGENAYRDRFAEARKAYAGFMADVRKFETEMLGLTSARTIEEQQAAAKRVQAARQALELAQDELKYRLLVDRGTVRAPQVTVTEGRADFKQPVAELRKTEALARISAGFQAQFGKDLNAINAARDAVGKNAVSLDSFLKDLFESAPTLAKQQGTATGRSFGEGVVDSIRRSLHSLDETLFPTGMLDRSFAGLQERARRFRLATNEPSRSVFAAPGETERDVTLARIRARAAERARRREAGEDVLGPGLFDRPAPVAPSAALFGGNKQVITDFLRLKGVTEDVLRDERLMTIELEKHIGPLREAYNIQRGLDDEIRSQVAGLNAMEAKARAVRAPSQAGFGDTIRNAAALFGGFSLGYTAVNGIRNQMRTYLQFEQEIAGIQGVLKDRSEADAQILAQGIGQAASKYGKNLLETAQAARVLAQSGLETDEVLKTLDQTLSAAVGLGMTIEQVEELTVAIRAVTSDTDRYISRIDYTAATLEKISQIEARYAVNSQDLANALKITLPILDNFSDGMTGVADAIDYANALTTVMVERLRITGNQAANVQKLVFSRLTRPEVLKGLQKNFKLELGTEDGTDFLPLDQLLRVLGRKYDELSKKNPFQAKQLADQIGGGRNVHAVLAVLENYRRVQDIATESANSFGTVQERTAIATDTLFTAIERFRTNLALANRSMLDSSNIAEGLRVIISGLANVLGGASGTGASPAALVGGILVLGAVIQGLRKAYTSITAAQALAAVSAKAHAGAMLTEAEAALLAAAANNANAASATAVGAASNVAATGVTRLTVATGTLARFFGPGAIILAGLAGTVAIIGALSKAFDDGAKDAERYRVSVASLEDLKVQDSPQLQELEQRAQRLKLGTAREAFGATLSALVTQPSPEMQQALADVQRLQGAVDGSFEKARDKAVEVFIKSLPEAAQQGFGLIESKTKRVAEAVQLVGGAAFSANVQIARAIDGVRESTARMVTEALNGLDRIDRKKREGVFNNIGNEFDRLLSGGGDLQQKVTITPRPVSGYTSRGGIGSSQYTPEQFVNQILRPNVSNSPVLDYFLKREKQLTSDALLASAKKFEGQPNVQVQDVMRDFFQSLAENPQLFSALKTSAAIQLNQFGLVQGVGRNATDLSRDETLTPEERTRAALSAPFELLAKTLAQETETLLNQAKPEAGQLNTLARILSDGVNPTSVLGKTPNQASTALIRLKDSVLDAALAFNEAIRKLAFDESFARRFGTGFDRGGAFVDIGRSVLQRGSDFETNRLAEGARLRRELALLEQYTTRDGDGTKIDAKTRRTTEITEELEQRQKDFNRFRTETLAQAFTGPEGSKIFADLQGKLNEVLSGGADAFIDQNIQAALALIGEALIESGRAITDQQARQIDNLEVQQLYYQRQAGLLEQQLPVNATLAQRLQARATAAKLVYEAERRILITKRDAETGDKAAIQREIDRKDREFEINQVIEARTALLQAQQDLERQKVSNLDGMLSGFKRLATDTSIYEAIFNPQGDTAEERARAKAQAIRDVIVQTLAPISETLYGRFVDNFFSGIVDSLASNSTLGGILGSPESKMQTAIQQGSDFGAKAFYTAITTAGQIAAGYFTGQGQTAPSSTSPTNPANAQALKLDRKALLTGAGVIVGNVGGTLAGGGGQFAQFGSNLGATGGALLGAKLGLVGGPVGAVVGGLLGGLAGGLFDKGDDDARPDPVVKGLEAVERAQRETITAITNQTDALLRPENRLLNLPSNFSAIPSYLPNFGGGVGGSVPSQSMQYTDQRQITIRVNGGDLNEVRRVVRETVEEISGEATADAISAGRRNRSWS
jgi:hypothetical protein